MYGNRDYDNGNGENPYNIFDRMGRPKNIGWSVASSVSAGLSVFLSVFGWAGIVCGICAIVFAILSRRALGYFNGWSIVGLLVGIVGLVFSTSMVIIAFTNPELLKEILGFVSVPGTGSETPPSTTDRT